MPQPTPSPHAATPRTTLRGRAVELLTIAAFALIICSALLQGVLHIVNLPPLGGYMPGAFEGNILHALFADNDKTRHALEERLNATYPLRNPLVRTWNEFQLLVFRDHRKIHSGEDGWVAAKEFLLTALSLEKKAATEPQTLLNNLERLEQVLAKTDAHCFILLPPLKTRVYPEYFPNLPRVLTDEGTVNRLLRTEAGRFPHLHFIDAYATVLAGKPFARQYYKGDAHWTDHPGNLLAMEVLTDINAIQDIGFTRPRLIPTEDGLSGWDYEYSLSRGFTPTPERTTPFRYDITITPKPGFSLGFGFYAQPEGQGRPDAPSLLVIGDSFFHFFMLGQYMADFFRTTTFYSAPGVAGSGFKALYAEHATYRRFVLIELYECSTMNLLFSQPWWENLLQALDAPGR